MDESDDGAYSVQGSAHTSNTTLKHVGRSHKRVRVSRACQSCRKKKISCSAEQPCKRCQEDEILCEFNNIDGRSNRAKKKRPEDPDNADDANLTGGIVNTRFHPQLTAREDNLAESRSSTTSALGLSAEKSLDSSRNSPAKDYGHDEQHTGPTSGLSFLQQAVERIESSRHNQTSMKRLQDRCVPTSVSIFTCGDVPSPAPSSTTFEMPDEETSNQMLSRYFDFATPTYRFFHRPTVYGWTQILFRRNSRSLSELSHTHNQLLPAQEAAVYLIWAQASEYHGSASERIGNSNSLYEKANQLLEMEPGPPQLESVQARLAMCLYLLSTSRINECWYKFGVTSLVIMALGLQCKTAVESFQGSLVEFESRKRVFWGAYILDRYLSVMKGRPRIFRDEDINQEFPTNVCDDDLVLTDKELLPFLPQHGLLELTVNHAKLSYIMGKSSDLLYPLTPPPKVELLLRAELLMKELEELKESLPLFLKPSENTLTGGRIYERQNTVMKLSYAHVQIFITRQFLLDDFATLGQTSSIDSDDISKRFVNKCINATLVIIDTVDAFISNKTLIHGFWFTQYIALCAISTFYIYIIHHHLEASTIVSKSSEPYFEVVNRCQKFFASITLEGSATKRYHSMLTQLRRKAHKVAYRSEVQHKDSASTSMEGQANGPTNLMAAIANCKSTEDQEYFARQMQRVVSNENDQRPILGSESLNIQSIVGFNTENLSWGFIDQMELPENLNQNLDFFTL